MGKDEKRKRKAERRKTLIRILRNLFGRGSRLARRVRLPAFHHGSCQRDASPQGSASGQASWDVVSTGVIRCRLSQSSGSTPRTGRNAGEHDARSRPGVAVTSRRPRVPHPAPISRCRRLTYFHDERDEAPRPNRERPVNRNCRHKTCGSRKSRTRGHLSACESNSTNRDAVLCDPPDWCHSRDSQLSSLPDLIRQSIRRLSMDHRVKPGGGKWEHESQTTPFAEQQCPAMTGVSPRSSRSQPRCG